MCHGGNSKVSSGAHQQAPKHLHIVIVVVVVLLSVIQGDYHVTSVVYQNKKETLLYMKGDTCSGQKKNCIARMGDSREEPQPRN